MCSSLCAFQDTSAVFWVKQRREVGASACNDQLRVKVPVLIDSKQPVPDLAFFQKRPANEPAQPLFETWIVSRR